MTRVERWERRTEVPLLLLAFAFLVAYAWPVLNPELDRDLITTLTTVSWTVYGAFAIDFGIRLWLADDRWDYTKRHWYDVVLIMLPLLRQFRVLRLLALVRLLGRVAARSLVDRVMAYVVGSAVLAAGLGAIAVLDVEQEAEGANITTFGDALWWACATVTTVGYGDRFPVTGTGRMIAVALMIVGIALVGAITASVAAWMVAQVTAEARAGTTSVLPTRTPRRTDADRPGSREDP